MKVIFYGKKELRTKCSTISEFNQDLINLSDRMYEIMLKKNGIGLAANQIAIVKRITVIEIKKNQRLTLINPEIKPINSNKIRDKEGCLSIPGLFSIVDRYESLFVTAQNVFGEKMEFEAVGLLARVIQHEIDHLNGILYIDRLNKQNKKRLNPELKRLNPDHEFLNLNE